MAVASQKGGDLPVLFEEEVPVSSVSTRLHGVVEGHKSLCGASEFHVDTLYVVFDKVCKVPYRALSTLIRMPISGIYRFKGVGDVLAEQVEQSIVKPGEEVVFLPTHTASNPGTGEAFTVKCTSSASPGLSRRQREPEHQKFEQVQHASLGNVMVYKKDKTLGQSKKFKAEVQVMDIPNKIKVKFTSLFGYCGSATAPSQVGQYKEFNALIQVLDRNNWRTPEGALPSEVMATRCPAPSV